MSMSQSTRARKSENEDLLDSIFDDRNIEKLGDKLSNVIFRSVNRCLENKTIIDKLGDSLSDKICSAVMQSFQTKLDSLTNEISSVKADQVILQQKVEKIEASIAVISRPNTEITNSIRDISSLKRQYDNLDRQSRRDNLIINGLTPLSYSEVGHSSSNQGNIDEISMSQSTNVTVELSVMEFCSSVLKIDVVPTDISVAHRLAPRHTAAQSNTTSSVIVKFTNRKIRDKIYAARKNLKGHVPRIFINEHLSSETATLFKIARDLAKQKKISSTWTYNGLLFAKLSDLPTTRPIRIDRRSDLPQ